MMLPPRAVGALALLTIGTGCTISLPPGETGGWRERWPFRLSCNELLRRGASDPPAPDAFGIPVTFDYAVARCKAISNVLRYRFAPDEPPELYAKWAAGEDGAPNYKLILRQMFESLVRDERAALPGLQCPDPVVNMVPAQATAGLTRILYTEEQAFSIFAAHVAHALYREAKETFSWSIFDLSRSELQELFDSYSYFYVLAAGESVTDADGDPLVLDRAPPWRAPPTYAICDPRDGYRFLRGETSTAGTDFLAGAPSEELMLGRLSMWFAENVVHGGARFNNGMDELSDRAAVAASSTVPGRLLGRDLTGLPEGNWGVPVVAREGCQAVVNLFYDLAKSVNIPLRVATRPDLPGRQTAGHSALVYRFDRPGVPPLIVEHGDAIISEGIGPGPHAPFYPISDTGESVVDPDARALQYFRAMWRPIGDLRARGFTYEAEALGSIPVMLAELPLDPTSDLRMVDRETAATWIDPAETAFQDRGYFVGHWPGIFLVGGLYLDAGADLCTRDFIQQNYCTLTDQSESGLRAHLTDLIATLTGRPATDPTVDQLVVRIQACVAAAPGCAEIGDADGPFRANLGANRWRD